MRHYGRARSIAGILLVCLLPATAGPGRGAKPAAETLAHKAGQLYKTAVSAMRTRQHQQAEGLFAKYVKTYPTHEYVPVGYLLLASCRSQLKDTEGYREALTEATRRYTGSPAWFTAYKALMTDARKSKDADRYFLLLEGMVRPMPRAPWRIQGSIGWEFGHYQRMEYQGQFRPRACRLESFRHGGGWVMGLVEMADTQERAQRALKLLAKNFQNRRDELPPDWQYVHVLLTERAGAAEEAAKAWDEYVKGWGDDPHLISLWQVKMAQAQAAKDDKGVAEAFSKIMEKFGGSPSLETFVYRHMEELWRRKKHDEYITWVGYYLKTYPMSYWSHSVVRNWVGLAKQAAEKGDTAQAEAAGKMLAELGDAGGPGRERSRLHLRIDLLGTLKKEAEAAGLAARLLAPEHWSEQAFATLNGHARRHKAFAEVVQAARARHKIPLPDPTSKAFVALHKLKSRLAGDQLRHAEEIGEEIYSAHRNDASTIEAVKLLADYCFKKVLPAPRDKWMDRMVASYPSHPATQAVLANQITAEYAAKRYDRLAGAIDTAEARFGGTLGKWYNQRMACFRVDHDSDGALGYARKVHGPRAEAGDSHSLYELSRYELAGKGRDFKAIGDYWMAWARKHAGKRLETHCYRRAWQGYYYSPMHSSARDQIQWDAALEVVKAMRDQTRDPELKWRMAFGEVNLLAAKGDGEAALEALNAHLEEGGTFRDLYLRVELAQLGGALGTSKMVKQGRDLARRLKKVCFTNDDACAIELMLASMYGALKAYNRAAEHCINAVRTYPFAPRMYPHMRTALRYLAHTRSRRHPSELEAYIRRAARAQEIVAPLLHEAGVFYAQARSSAALDMRKRLVGGYPASGSRDRLDAYLDKLRRQQRQQK